MINDTLLKKTILGAKIIENLYFFCVTPNTVAKNDFLVYWFQEVWYFRIMLKNWKMLSPAPVISPTIQKNCDLLVLLWNKVVLKYHQIEKT